MRLAFFVHPHLGGTYSVYRTLRAGMLRSGTDLVWIGLEKPSGAPARDAGDGSGFYMVPEGRADGAAVARLTERLLDENFDGVFVNVLTDHGQMNLARYLPARLLRIMIVHNITPATYAAARALRDHVHATVGVSERCRHDLVTRHGFPLATTVSIDNAIDLSGYLATERRPQPVDHARLIFLGRIDDAAKGVFWLPKIMDELPTRYMLTVAGDGPDLPELRRRLERHATRTLFEGAVAAHAVPQLLSRHDLLVMPSRFEGFGLVCVEAMAAGCVPVVSRIRGVTDTIVDDGRTGRLFGISAWRDAARIIAELGADPAQLTAMSQRARANAFERFGADRMASAYLGLLERVRRAPPVIAPPLPLERYALPAAFAPGMRAWIPGPLKNWLRVARERLASPITEEHP